MPLSKPFSIATSGKTVDGREISRDWITQMAANYNPKVYTAVANLEHFLSSIPDAIFKAYGKVASLSTREVEILGEKQLQLMAVVDANQEIVDLQKKGQKSFASIEVLNNFVDKGIAYLSGLAFTDSPASLGTESMKFSAAGASGERFCFSEEIELSFDASAPETTGATLFNKVKELLGIKDKTDEARFADQAEAITALATSQRAVLENTSATNTRLTELTSELATCKKQAQETADQFAALHTKLSQESSGTRRSAATGSDGALKTDC